MQVIEANTFKHLVDLKRTFRTADYVQPYTVFDIAGDRYRLIAVIDYTLEIVTVTHVMAGRLTPADHEAVGKYLSAVAPFVESYEMQRYPTRPVTPEEMLRFFMEQHGLTQYDLAEDLGGQPVVSDVLRGKWRLSREHIERLSRRFSVAPATFYAARPQA